MREKISEFISELGGTVAVARICGITKGAVSHWRTNNKIPKAQENFLKTKFPKEYKEVFLDTSEPTDA